ncbi:MAG TPA: SulP family inorganic anion transporter, partial [Spirochaetota bacterium]|nr:SulP family inorganic anion transporter [Spirochaetota bacterium]
GVSPDKAVLFMALVALSAGIIQLVAGLAGGGTFIKYIPYPVVAGYLGGVGILIFMGQLPQFLGLPKGTEIMRGILAPGLWRWESLVIGAVTIVVMLITPRVLKSVPASIAALGSGIASFFIIAFFQPAYLSLEQNPLVIGAISVSGSGIWSAIAHNVSLVPALSLADFGYIVLPAFTLGVLLSIDTLKTCVVLDVLTGTRHKSNRELFGQGLANIASAAFGGVPGSGTTGGTLVNHFSGGTTRRSGVIEGLSALVVLALLAKFIAWIPVASLAGVLLVVGARMIDRKSLQLLRHRSTVFDFLVILAVVVAAVGTSLITAAAVGIVFAIALFLREQIRFNVVRRRSFGYQIFSKKNRLQSEHVVLERKGRDTLVIELQGQLFFGTTDQLYTEIEPFIGRCRFFILDMRRVLAVDFTAANMLTQIKRNINRRGGSLIFSSVPMSLPTGQNVREYLEMLGFAQESGNVMFFRELDDALEWVEEEYLREEDLDSRKRRPLRLAEFEFFAGISEKALETLERSVEEKKFAGGEKIFSLGDPGGDIYFIKKGSVRIDLPLVNGSAHHVTTFNRGDFFGDMSFLDREPRSADAIAAEDVELYVLARGRFDEAATEYPEIAGIFFSRLAYEIAHRLRVNVKELKAMEEA